MKILYGVTKGNWGGAQKQVFELAKAMKDAGNDVCVLFGQPGILKDRCEALNISTFVLPEMQRNISLHKEIKSFNALVKLFRKERPDVVHLHSPKMGGLGGLAARVVGIKKIIYTAHGWPFNENRSPLQKAAIKLFSWVTIILSHTTIVLSEKEKHQVEDWPFVKNKIIIIPNGIKEINFLEKEKARWKINDIIKKNIDPETPWIGTIAELHKNKGLEYGISALATLSEPFIYFIFGEGEERKNLETQINSSNLVDKVFLLGFQDEASSLLKAFDVFLFPSIKEGFPYALLEAGSAGLPVIATGVGGIPEIIINNESGIIIDSKNSTEITTSLKKALTSKENLTKLGQNLSQKIKEDLTFERMIEKLKILYKTTHN